MDFERSEEAMGIDCQEVWRDISDYIDEDLDPFQRTVWIGILRSAAIAPRSSIVCAMSLLFTAMSACWLRRMVSMNAYIRD